MGTPWTEARVVFPSLRSGPQNPFKPKFYFAVVLGEHFGAGFFGIRKNIYRVVKTHFPGWIKPPDFFWRGHNPFFGGGRTSKRNNTVGLQGSKTALSSFTSTPQLSPHRQVLMMKPFLWSKTFLPPSKTFLPLPKRFYRFLWQSTTFRAMLNDLPWDRTVGLFFGWPWRWSIRSDQSAELGTPWTETRVVGPSLRSGPQETLF